MFSVYKESDVLSQIGRTALVTGANTGIGFETARVLAARGARVLLGCRDQDKASAAIDAIRQTTADADLAWLRLDLASLDSIKAAADVVQDEPCLDMLINNAGVMMPPRTLTEDGFELQFGVNHLGHFALTGHLLPMMIDVAGARIVNVSSLAHRGGRIDYSDVHAERRYNRLERYSMSKFANLLFTNELQRKLESAKSPALSVACHPGGSNTDLDRHFPAFLQLATLPFQLLLNSPAEGALPTLMAATHPDVGGSDYYGPAGFGEVARSARKVDSVYSAKSEEDAARLWRLSVELTGVDYAFS